MTEEKFKIAKPGNYVTEEGRKAEVVAENMNARIESRWIGWVDGKARAWRADGVAMSPDGPLRDSIVDVWADKVEWDWSTTLPWLNHIAQDGDGRWYLYQNLPRWDSARQRWTYSGTGVTFGESGGGIFEVPKKFAPKWEGTDCSKSLASRPPATDAPNVGLLVEIGTEFCEYVKDRTPTNRNCSCHISPPCSDCTEHAHNRELIEHWERETVKPCYKKAS